MGKQTRHVFKSIHSLGRACYFNVVTQDTPPPNALNRLALGKVSTSGFTSPPFLPQTSSVKAIPGCYLFTRSLASFCIRFQRSPYNPNDSINFLRHFILFFGGEDLGGEQATPSRPRLEQRAYPGRRTGCPISFPAEAAAISRQRVEAA